MKFLQGSKTVALMLSFLCHAMILTGFANHLSVSEQPLVRAPGRVTLLLDLLQPLKPTEESVIPKSVPTQIPVKAKTSTIDPALLQKQAELDERIKAIRAKLKRTVKKQELQRASDIQKGSQILSLEKKGPEWESYLQEIRGKVLERWYPKLVSTERSLIKSEARLDFTIFLDGEVNYFKITDSKGSEAFQRICLEAFREAMPFEPFLKNPPKNTKKKSFPLTLFFYYQ